MNRNVWQKRCALLALSAVTLQPMLALAQQPVRDDDEQAGQKVMEIAPRSSSQVAGYMVRPEEEAYLSHEEKLELLKKHVKYVFVLFQENRSFDYYFGTYPGARGLYSQPAAKTAGLVQPIINTDGSVGTISPFKIPATITDVNGKTVQLYPADVDSVNHAHAAIDAKLDVDKNNVPHNDRYAVTEEGFTLVNGKPSGIPTHAQKQMGELVMSHVDCDTAPFLWNYADRFTLFDNFFDTVIGPSTPNAIAMIAGQSGETQWVKHPQLASNITTTNAGLPVVGDPDPYWGSSLDVFSDPQQPEPGRTTDPASNLTFASLPLSFMGSKIYDTTSYDQNPAFDLLDVQGDMDAIAGNGAKPVNWGWYQQGYNHEPTDGNGPATNNDYIAHHNGPQYFGYVSNNTEVTKHLHGLGDFYNDMKNTALPKDGGVFYVRGGYNNIAGLTPVDPNPKLATVFNGNDDHPGYSDTQISEALLADEINTIANSPYWKDSAIVITYDETDGLYDHAKPRVRSQDPEGNPLDQGPRIPAIVISPYGVVHGVSHERAEHSSIIKMINELFDLTPLADLPDEAKARKKGEKLFGQKDLGPADDKVAGVGDLFTAFDNNRLLGKREPLPADYALIPTAQVSKLPHFSGVGCRVLGITPTDTGMPNNVPADFNPRPGSSPGIPSSGDWTP